MGTTTETRTERRPNRRGVLARERLLTTALDQLSTGRPEAASVNLIAKHAGLSWGSVQNLFGDSDGFWAAVVDLILERSEGQWPDVAGDGPARVAAIADAYLAVLDSPLAVAIETVRVGLPTQADEVRASHPRTAEALERLDRAWNAAFLRYFDSFADADRAADVATVLASGLRGLRVDAARGAAVDVDRARRTLVVALATHLT